jgi:hypothetical protein
MESRPRFGRQQVNQHLAEYGPSTVFTTLIARDGYLVFVHADLP